MQTLQTEMTTNHLAQTLLKRTDAMLKMKQVGLAPEWVQMYDLAQLCDCCLRMKAHITDLPAPDDTIQKELIDNPGFAQYYERLYMLLPEDLPEDSEEAKPFASRPRCSATFVKRISDLLDFCQTENCDITQFPEADTYDALLLDLTVESRLVFLHNFANMHLPQETQNILAANLDQCAAVPMQLNEEQKELLFSPFVATRDLFCTADFKEVWELLQTYPVLVEMIEYLHSRNIEDGLTLETYRSFGEKAAEYLKLMRTIFDQIQTDTADSFMSYWRQSGCPLKELQIMARRIDSFSDLDLEEVFSSYPGYINLLYGQRFKHIDLADVPRYQESILIYAIVRNKKNFIRLVDEHPEVFMGLPSTSPLFLPQFYEDHFNLNELTIQNFKTMGWMDRRRLPMDSFASGRVYTFPEVQTLYNKPEVYTQLYNLLTSEKQDYRLKVIKQLIKRNLLGRYTPLEELYTLADRLNEKPLYDWQEQNFGHIAGLQARDSVQMLFHLDELRDILPSLQNRTDVLLALRYSGQLAQYPAIEALKANMLQTDARWRELSELMELSVTFLEQYQESILQFLVRNGADMAMTYLTCLNEQQRVSFLRVVKGELMGKLEELKYFKGDLQKELSLPLNDRVMTCWRDNSTATHGSLCVRENDDFFSTMLLGTQPRRTCLSYVDGQYSPCLLAGFDTNKKVIYATLDGDIVGRAYLRLTKSRLGKGKKGVKGESSFTYVDLENVEGTRQDSLQGSEHLALFLERPYTSQIPPDIEREVTSLMVQLALEKANAMGAMLVLSSGYRGSQSKEFVYTELDIYISKSKAGSQYLDSLNGEATVSAEGSYHSNTFFVWDPAKTMTTK